MKNYSSLLASSLLVALGISAACGGLSRNEGSGASPHASSGAPTMSGAGGGFFGASAGIGANAGSSGPNDDGSSGGAGAGSSFAGYAGTELGGAPAQGGDGGGGGDAGAPDACSQTTWHATGSCTAAPEFLAFCEPAAQAIDGILQTRYTSGDRQKGTEDFSVTFPSTVTISGIAMAMLHPYDVPVQYEVEYSTDGELFLPFASPVMGAGADVLTRTDAGTGPWVVTITFPATALKAVRVKQTGTTGEFWWSIWELTVIDCTQT
jgi:hypothetical protein